MTIATKTSKKNLIQSTITSIMNETAKERDGRRTKELDFSMKKHPLDPEWRAEVLLRNTFTRCPRSRRDYKSRCQLDFHVVVRGHIFLGYPNLAKVVRNFANPINVNHCWYII